MIGPTMRHASAARRNWRRWTPALAGLGVVALAATGCGSSGNAATTPPAASPTASNRTAPAGAPAAFPGVIGTAAAVSGSSMEVQNPTSGQVTVTFSSATTITETVAVTSKDVTVGSCVAVVGQRPASGSAAGSAAGSASGSAGGPVTATTVTISAPVNGTCSAAGFGGFGGFGGGARGTFTPNPSFSPRPRPSGSRGAFGNGSFGGANGKVISVSAAGFVVQGRNRGTSAATSVTVTTSAATKYLKTVTARPSALKVGQCIAAIGTTNSIGAVAARSIRISQPGPNGCVTGFGRRGGFGGGSGTGQGGSGSNA